MNQLTRTGIVCDLNGENRVIIPYVICCCVDSVARAPMQGLHQFNGAFGCSWCLHSGKYDKINKSMKYPIRRSVRDRTHEESVKHVEMYEEKKTLYINQNRSTKKLHVKGFINRSPLLTLIMFDIINGFVPDYMHFVALGIGRTFASYWFNRNNNKFGIKDKINDLDEYLLQIKVHSAVDRLPQSIRNRKFWKAKEWLNWILYYSSIIISKFMRRDYVAHWNLLVEGMHILLQEKITFDDLNRASTLFDNFENQTRILYGNVAMTSNHHQLMHLVASVYNWGPLIAHNGFPFENANGLLVKNVHAARGIKQQVCRFIGFQKTLNFILYDLSNTNANDASSRYDAFYMRKTKHSRKVGSHVYFGKEQLLSENYLQLENLPINYAAYDRMLKNGRIFSTVENKRTNNSFAILHTRNYVKILKFIVDNNDSQEYCIVNHIETRKKFQNQLHQLQTVNSISVNPVIIPIRDIMVPSIYMTLRDQSSIIAMPQTYYF